MILFLLLLKKKKIIVNRRLIGSESHKLLPNTALLNFYSDNICSNVINAMHLNCAVDILCPAFCSKVSGVLYSQDEKIHMHVLRFADKWSTGNHVINVRKVGVKIALGVIKMEWLVRFSLRLALRGTEVRVTNTTVCSCSTVCIHVLLYIILAL